MAGEWSREERPDPRCLRKSVRFVWFPFDSPRLTVFLYSLTFAGGVRTCIGWRFALYEVLCLTIEIINKAIAWFEGKITGPVFGGAKYTPLQQDQRREIAGRLTMGWNPTPQLSVTLKAFASDYRDDAESSRSSTLMRSG